MLTLDALSFADEPTYANCRLPSFSSRLRWFITGTCARFFHEVCGVEFFVFPAGETADMGDEVNMSRCVSVGNVDATPDSHGYWGIWLNGRYARLVRLGSAERCRQRQGT